MAFSGGATNVVASPAGSSPMQVTPVSISVGSLVIVTVDGDGGLTFGNCTDTLGNTYTPISNQFNWSTGDMRSYYSIATSGGSSPTISVAYTGTNSSYYNIVVSRYVADGAISLDESNRDSQNTSSPEDSGSITVGANSMLYGYNDWTSSAVTGHGAGWTGRDDTGNEIVADYMNPGAGTYSYQPTFSGTQRWVCQIIGFTETFDAFEIAADGGSYVITGASAQLEYARLFAAAGGTYSITGTVAALEAARRLVANSGAYVLTGTAASLEAARIFGVDAGSYAITGTTADLLADRVILVDSGAYLISGTAASLEAARIFSVDGGSYLLSGADASLERGYVVAADGGTYLISGSDAGLSGTFLITADGGVYQISGKNTNLVLTPVGASASYYSYHRKRRR